MRTTAAATYTPALPPSFRARARPGRQAGVAATRSARDSRDARRESAAAAAGAYLIKSTNPLNELGCDKNLVAVATSTQKTV